MYDAEWRRNLLIRDFARTEDGLAAFNAAYGLDNDAVALFDLEIAGTEIEYFSRFLKADSDNRLQNVTSF